MPRSEHLADMTTDGLHDERNACLHLIDIRYDRCSESVVEFHADYADRLSDEIDRRNTHHPVPVVLHQVIVTAPVEFPASGWHVTVPPPGAFDPAAVRVTPVSEVRPGDTVIGTIQPHYDHLLQPLDRAQWVSYFSHTCRPQAGGARPFNPAHCDLCGHEAYARSINAASGYWTVDGCSTYRPGGLLLVVPRGWEQ